MAKNVQIRNVPESVHRVLRVRAAADGRSLSEYLLQELRRIATTPTIDEWMARRGRRTPVTGLASSADLIRQERDRRWS